jgi:short-subunit dehydrogenase
MHDALRFELTNRYHAPGVKTTLLLPGHIRTPLFDRIQFPRSLFFRFMAPSLEPEQVVAGIIMELEYKRNGVIRMPFYTQAVRFLNIGTGLVPGYIRNFLQWVSHYSTLRES